jgi:hypothetical protein
MCPRHGVYPVLTVPFVPVHRLPVQVQIREYCMLMELGYAVKDKKTASQN